MGFDVGTFAGVAEIVGGFLIGAGNLDAGVVDLDVDVNASIGFEAKGNFCVAAAAAFAFRNVVVSFFLACVGLSSLSSSGLNVLPFSVTPCEAVATFTPCRALPLLPWCLSLSSAGACDPHCLLYVYPPCPV
jgi:hypothetical protein